MQVLLCHGRLHFTALASCETARWPKSGEVAEVVVVWAEGGAPPVTSRFR